MIEPAAWPWPWARPQTVYDSEGPAVPTEAQAYSLRFRVSPTAEVSFDTGRTRFAITCLACGEELHHATTRPDAYAQRHARRCRATGGTK